MFKKFPWIQQQDASDCGAAVLSSICDYYGVRTPLARIRDIAWTDREGTTLLGLKKAAEELGFAAKGAKGEWDALKTVPLPAVAHVIVDKVRPHYVCVYKVKNDTVWVSDPSTGLKKLSREEFCRDWTGYVLLLTPQNLVPESHTISKKEFLWTLLGPHWNAFAAIFVCGLLVTLLGVAGAFFIQLLLDSILVQYQMNLLHMTAIGMLLATAFRELFSFLRGYLTLGIAVKMDLVLVSCFIRHVLRLPLKFFETRRVGDVLARVQESRSVRNAVNSLMQTLVLDVMILIAAIAIMWATQPLLAAIGLAFLVPFAVLMAVFRKPLATGQTELMELHATMDSETIENIAGAETIKAYVEEERRIYLAETTLVRLLNKNFEVGRLGLYLSAAANFVSMAGTLAVLWYGGQQVINGGLTIGQLMFFYTLIGYLFRPLVNLAQLSIQLQEAAVALQRLWEILCLELEDKPTANAPQSAQMRDGIKLENVTFGYGYRGAVLKELSLVIPAGKTVAFVGESGSGKSSLCKLLLRFYDPQQGRVTLDGVDYRDLPLNQLRGMIGYVPQEPFIFNGTISDNIAFGQPDANQRQIVEAARMAGLHEFIETLPCRYNAKIGDRGTTLSGGQRQRLALARALIGTPALFILDEATSHLDSLTERTIQATIEQSLKNRTAVIVAHRLSTIRNADIIYVLQEGRIAERGTHTELLGKRGDYARLWAAQTQMERTASALTELEAIR